MAKAAAASPASAASSASAADPAIAAAQAANAADPAPTVNDSDFVIESFSAPQDQAPEDTTARAAAPATDDADGAGRRPEEDPDGDEDGTADPDGTADEGADAAQPAAKPAQAAAGGKKKQVPLAKRVVDQKAELDRVTFQRRDAERQLQATRDEIARLRGQDPAAAAAAAADGRPAAKPAAAAKPGDAPAAMPTVPDYQDFGTDDEYRAAMGKFQTDMGAWVTAQMGAVETRAVAGVDGLLASRAADSNAATVLGRAREKHADWGEKAEALGELRSSWYDPARHGNQYGATPFLSELAQTRLAQGRDEGAEMLYFLGSDPERAQALADLQPTRAIRLALLKAPAILPLLTHFATEPGSAEFEQLARMLPDDVPFAIGALSARLQAASRGPAKKAVEPITRALPSTRPQVGDASGAPRAGAKRDDFYSEFMELNAKEQAEKLRHAGLTP